MKNQWSNGNLGIAKTKFQVDEYTRLEEEETLIGNGTVFFANQLNFWGQTTLVLGLLKLEISLSFDKKYFARKSLSFRNIFDILFRLIQECLKT